VDCEHRALLNRTVEFIEATRDEILRLRHEIEPARIKIDQSHDRLSRTSALPRTSGSINRAVSLARPF
jgi:hypothetical protein